MGGELFCHYYDSAEREIHIEDIKPCSNCWVPVCYSCRIGDFCLECDKIKGDPKELLLRALEMGAFYGKWGAYTGYL